MAYLDNDSQLYSQPQNAVVTKCSNFNISTGCKNPGDIDFVRKLSKTAKENTNRYNLRTTAKLSRPYRTVISLYSAKRNKNDILRLLFHFNGR